MKKIAVEGIGVICNLGADVDEVWENLSQEKEIVISQEAIKYKSVLPPIKRRRMSGYSDMILYTASKALADRNVSTEEVGSYNIGTIYSTGFGPVDTLIKFDDTVLDGEPDLCSPTVFANTVANACLGNMCINLKLKGVSTILMGSDNWSYSQGLINKGDALYILSGNIEENCKQVFDSVREEKYSQNIPVKESSVSFLLGEAEENQEAYADYVESIQGDIGGYPLFEQVDKEAAYDMILDMAKEMKEKYSFDAIFTSCNGSYFDQIEKKALTDVFGSDMTYVDHVKALMGETLGGAYNINMLVAALCIKHEKLPVNLDKKEKKVNRVLVASYDVSGNYYLAVLQNHM